MYILTISKPCAATLWVLWVAAALFRSAVLSCSQPRPHLPPRALHLHGAKPCDDTRLQATRQGGLRTWRSTLVPANLENGEVGCRSTENLSTAAKMGGAARRERERYAPAGSLPAAPASAQ